MFSRHWGRGGGGGGGISHSQRWVNGKMSLIFSSVCTHAIRDSVIT